MQTSEPVPYRAGQYLSVETPQRPRLWRYLSPAIAPRDDGRLEFHVRAVPNGWVSRAIVAHTRVGDTWRIGPPMGRMHVDRSSGRNVLMVAGGTGSAPIRALLEDLARGTGQPRTQVFVGGRTWDDLYDFAPLRRLSYSQPVARRHPGGGARRHRARAARSIGTLAEVVTRYGAWADHDVTVCGSPAMIRSTVSRMLVAGTPLDRITLRPVHAGLMRAGRVLPARVRPRAAPARGRPGPRAGSAVVGCRLPVTAAWRRGSLRGDR